MVGVGEASFISLAAPFIDDNAPIPQVVGFVSFLEECLKLDFSSVFAHYIITISNSLS